MLTSQQAENLHAMLTSSKPPEQNQVESLIGKRAGHALAAYLERTRLLARTLGAVASVLALVGGKSASAPLGDERAS